ncbi:Glycolate dehydrogenase, FAD-binding subunit GlcE [hydrothermal vent metagenome]|uniref:Glycolate dehydrogenase, FAD-binding subunit GlcE n=1 Tax=hydrothermal vent metagenome TaxID=652676 RepID=A0A3B1BYS4_9ZZZZ
MAENTEQQLQDKVQQAITDKQPLKIIGGNSKHFYGRPLSGRECSSMNHQGIINYQATELVITAKAGTRLTELEQVLAKHNQILAFEPPRFNSSSTIGGCIAAGLSGPARPFSGAARDFVLGFRIINGKAEVVKFGGEVIKNVAGYDLSRLLTGSLGTLGLLLEVSLKTMPRPAHTLSLRFEMDETQAINNINQYINQALPITASCIRDQQLLLRLSGAKTAVEAAHKKFSGETVDNKIWLSLQNQTDSFFKQKNNLWRLSLPPTTPPVSLKGSQLIEWNGAQRWLYSDEPANDIYKLAHSLGGHACLFKPEKPAQQVFQPLDENLMALQRTVKQAMDPQGIFNPGRMYKEL